MSATSTAPHFASVSRSAAGAVSLVCGALFGVGLVVGGMTDPQKVQAFLDLAGAWDPSLAFVMGSAVATCALFSWLARRRASPVFEKRFASPDTNANDGRLLTGAALFGVGWGLCGVCPGPGILSLGTTGVWPLVFVAAMAIGARTDGMVPGGWSGQRKSRRATTSTSF